MTANVLVRLVPTRTVGPPRRLGQAPEDAAPNVPLVLAEATLGLRQVAPGRLHLRQVPQRLTIDNLHKRQTLVARRRPIPQTALRCPTCKVGVPFPVIPWQNIANTTASLAVGPLRAGAGGLGCKAAVTIRPSLLIGRRGPPKEAPKRTKLAAAEVWLTRTKPSRLLGDDVPTPTRTPPAEPIGPLTAVAGGKPRLPPAGPSLGFAALALRESTQAAAGPVVGQACKVAVRPQAVVLRARNSGRVV